MGILTNDIQCTTSTVGGNDVATKVYVDSVDEWEVVAGQILPKAGIANSMALLTSSSQVFTKTGDSTTGDYTSPGANIEYNTDHWQNIGTPTGNVIFETTDWVLVSGTTDSGSFQNMLNGTAWWRGSSNNVVTFDLTTPAIINEAKARYAGNDTLTVWGSNDDVDYTLLADDIATTGGVLSGSTFENSTAYRYYRVEVGAWNYLYALELHGLTYPSTDNTVETEVYTGDSLYIPNTGIVIKDENGSTISDTGKVNIDYNVNGNGYTGTMMDLMDFRETMIPDFLSVSSLSIKVQPVNGVQFTDVVATQPTTEAKTSDNGTLGIYSSGVLAGQMSPAGYTFPDGSVQLKAQTDDTINALIDAKDEWEIISNQLVPKAGIATSMALLTSATNTYTSTGDSSTGDYTSPGANISYDTSYWINGANSTGDVIYNVLGTLHSGTIDGGAIASLTNGSGAWIRFSSDAEVDFDITTPQVVNEVTIKHLNSASTTSVSGSNDGTNFTMLGENLPTVGGVLYSVSFDNSTAYRYYRVKIGAWNYCYGLQLAGNVYYDTNNTVETEIYSGDSTYLSNTSLTVKDNNGTSITDAGKINIDYNINEGGYTGDLIDLQAFKAEQIPELLDATSLSVKVQPIGSQKFTDVVITEPATEARVSETGRFGVYAAGSLVGEINPSGITFADGTTQGTAVNKVDAPSSATDFGEVGQIAWDADYIYICTAANTWKRTAVTTW